MSTLGSGGFRTPPLIVHTGYEALSTNFTIGIAAKPLTADNPEGVWTSVVIGVNELSSLGVGGVMNPVEEVEDGML
jgi:hypothetical protein